MINNFNIFNCIMVGIDIFTIRNKKSVFNFVLLESKTNTSFCIVLYCIVLYYILYIIYYILYIIYYIYILYINY